MVPEGWKERKLGQVAFLQRGFDLPGRERVEGDIPIISSSGISGYHNEHQVEGPGVVTGRYGTIGEVFFVQNKFWPLNTALWVKEFHGNDQKYVYYLLSKIDYKKFSDKTGIPGVNRNDLHTVKVPVPPKNEQKKIAHILSTWDKAIETVEKLIENSKAQKKALMQQLLTGKRRLPTFASHPWNFCKLKELCDVRRGASPRPIQDPKWFTDQGRAWVRIADVTSSPTRFLNVASQYLSPLGETKSVKVEPGELIMSICATIGVPRIVNIPACIHDGFVVFRRYEEKLDTTFLYHFLNKETEKLASGGQPGTQKNLNTSIVGNIQIPLISLQEQKEIANVLTKSEEEIAKLELRRSALVTEKKALMQQLLTGKRRVKVDEA